MQHAGQYTEESVGHRILPKASCRRKRKERGMVGKQLRISFAMKVLCYMFTNYNSIKPIHKISIWLLSVIYQ